MNQFDHPNAWTRYVPKDEPAAITAIWDRAAALVERASKIDDYQIDESESERLMREVYGKLAEMRRLGVNVGFYTNKRHGRADSQLIRHGENWERKIKRRAARVSRESA